MEALRYSTHIPTFTTFLKPQLHQPCLNNSKLKPKNRRNPSPIIAKIRNDDDPLLQSALTSATLRFLETHCSEPLFHDHHVGCLVPTNASIDMKHQTHPYCLATRFIDDKLLQMLRTTDDLKQVVFLTDGADTRAFRLSWPSSTLMFDISSERIYVEASQKFKDVGAQISRSCMLLHIPLDSSNIQEALCKKGFNGNRPSIWILQGLPMMTLAALENILLTIGSLAMKGCVLMGEIPVWLAETNLELKISREEWLHKLFMSHGFHVQMIDYENLATSLGRELSKETYNRILFTAEHLRFSDDQMEMWRREFQRAEEEGDEDGFEDL